MIYNHTYYFLYEHFVIYIIMFTRLTEMGYDNELKERAITHIIRDRSAYLDIIQYILNFCTKNNLLISNIDLLLDTQKYWDYVDIHALDVDTMAKTLLGELCRSFDQQFYMRIVNVGKEYFIEYDLRKMCTFTAIRPYKSYTIYDFIMPIKYESYHLLPYMLEVIHLYNQLYDTLQVDEWVNIFSNTKKVEEKIDKEIHSIQTATNQTLDFLISSHGTQQLETSLISVETNTNPPRSVTDKSKATTTSVAGKNIQNLKKNIVDCAKTLSYVLVGEFAYIINTVDSSQSDPLASIDSTLAVELISPNAIEDDVAFMISYVSKFTDLELTYKKKDLYLPKESILEKYSFYLNIPCNDKKKHILTIYNNATYRIIHYNLVHGYKIADPIVQTRYIYISIWSSIIARRVHGLDATTFQTFIKVRKNMLNYYRDKINIYEKKLSYIGQYVNAETEQILQSIRNPNRYKSSYYCHDSITK